MMLHLCLTVYFVYCLTKITTFMKGDIRIYPQTECGMDKINNLNTPCQNYVTALDAFNLVLLFPCVCKSVLTISFLSDAL